MEKILEIKGLTKHYGRIRAVHMLDMEVGRGQVYGILGPNGSGKTTTLSVIMGVIRQQSGTFSWFGNGYSTGWKKRVGSLIEVPNFYPYLSLVKNLEIIALIKEVPAGDIDRVLEVTGLINRKHSPYRTLSLGMKQRLAMAAVLLGDPEVMVLDEPTNGLDPEGIAEVREIISDEAEKGKTVILASHILGEVEKVCSHVAVLKEGELLASGRVDELLGSDPVYMVSATDIQRFEEIIVRAGKAKKIEKKGDDLIITCSSPLPPEEINRFAFENGIVLSKLVPVKKSLESHFLELVK
ncbi:MAG: ATP-binding cassette domain-containing protein [Marinilabiliales bacterium]|nr:MAG: ATP-binding cassette domain-containing protein [Marinilabiliales bacterium]